MSPADATGNQPAPIVHSGVLYVNNNGMVLQALDAEHEGLQHLVGVLHHDVALDQHLRLLEDRFPVGAVRELVPAVPHGLGFRSHLGESCVHAVDVPLLDGDLGLPDGVLRHPRSRSV